MNQQDNNDIIPGDLQQERQNVVALTDYSFEFNPDEGIAKIVDASVEGIRNGRHIVTRDPAPWWVTTEVHIGKGFFEAEDTLIKYYHWATYYYRCDDILPFVSLDAFNAFNNFLGYQAPATLAEQHHGLFPRCPKQDFENLLASLWDATVLTLQEQFEKILPLWTFTPEGFDSTANFRQRNNWEHTVTSINPHQRCHIFLFKLRDLRVRYSITSDLDFEVFVARFLLELDLQFCKGLNFPRDLCLSALQEYTDHLGNYKRTRERQRDVLLHSTTGQTSYAGHTLGRLTWHITRVERILACVEKEVAGVQSFPDSTLGNSFYHIALPRS